jgi:PIN domain nuclease of toxin-antitoxin system
VRALLDTHIWLWFLLADKRLAKTHKRIILDDESDLYLSPISIWEAHLLIERGRLKGANGTAWLEEGLKKLPLQEARLTFAVAQRARNLQLSHQDPADRFIAATAAEMRIPLLTADSHLLRCPDIHCVR